LYLCRMRDGVKPLRSNNHPVLLSKMIKYWG